MGKVEDMRAMKQARREQVAGDAARATAPVSRPRPAAVPVPVEVVPVEVAPVEEDPAEDRAEDPAGALCGHAAIGGKRCTRPKDHPERNHRYASA